MLVLDKIELNKIFLLENIYYNFNRADIREDAAKELDKLVQLLIDNPEIKIELGSHTDSVDTDSFNLRSLTAPCGICGHVTLSKMELLRIELWQKDMVSRNLLRETPILMEQTTQ